VVERLIKEDCVPFNAALILRNSRRLRRANEEILQLQREIKIVHGTYRDNFVEAVLVKVS
jgi:hypothetical protein